MAPRKPTQEGGSAQEGAQSACRHSTLKLRARRFYNPGEFTILQKSFLHCGESSSERLPLPPVSSPHPREARVRKRGAPRPSQTRRCQPTLVHPRMRGVSTWGMQTHELDLSNAPGISARLPVHSPGNFPFWSVLGIQISSQSDHTKQLTGLD